MATYPGGIPDIPATGWTHDQVAQEIEAIATELGVSPSGAAADVAEALLSASTRAVGRYMGTMIRHGGVQNAGSGGQIGNGILWATPIEIQFPLYVDAMNVNVSQAGEAGSVCRLGVYAASRTTSYPETLVVDAGTINFAATGDYTKTFTAVRLPRGPYWMVAIANDASGTGRLRNSTSEDVITATAWRGMGGAMSTELIGAHKHNSPGFVATDAFPATLSLTSHVGTQGFPILCMRRSA